MTNVIKKECIACGHPECDILGAMIGNITNEIGEITEERGSFNDYKCLKCKTRFFVKRNGDVVEQELTEKFIISTSIFLD